MKAMVSIIGVDKSARKASPARSKASRGDVLTCEQCDSPFEVRSHRGSPRQFCSARCRTAAWRARKERAS